ncbi:hypothetical protein C2G38_2214945 [Gigaspora rosea]|uniref:Uncharacterized protein n=1 Tax=Gigaspora rosea TaxID=44941 RepID=A0A397UAC7_9GLOM|nr:hypothetical protein C2G38_2214945 [Gigaspora rosea]
MAIMKMIEMILEFLEMHCSQMSVKFLKRFSNDFSQLPENEYDYNVVNEVGKQHNKQLLRYLKSFSFRYIYTGVISFENVENSTKFDILISSDKLDFDELVEYIQTYLIDNNASCLRLNFAQVHNASFEIDSRFVQIQVIYKVVFRFDLNGP